MQNFKLTFRGRVIMIRAETKTHAVMKARQIARTGKMILINVTLMPGVVNKSRRILRG